MTGFHRFTAAPEFKQTFYELVRDLLGTDERFQYVAVSLGTPSSLDPEDIVSFMSTTSDQTPATIGNRGRDESLIQDVQISCWRGGDDEQAVQARAYEILGAIEEYVRKQDPTIGGTVMWCFLISHESQGFTDPDDIAKGRTADILARFQAQARISL